jgi:hypothetical protein
MPPRIAPTTSVVVMTMRKAVCGGGFGGYLLRAGTRTSKIVSPPVHRRDPPQQASGLLPEPTRILRFAGAEWRGSSCPGRSARHCTSISTSKK